MVWLYVLTSVILVSFISLIGAFTLALKKTTLQKITFYLVSFAVGGLFGDAFIHLLPEAFEHLGTGLNTALLTLSGLLLFFILEKILRWQHCHIHPSKQHVHPMSLMSLTSNAIHNLIDGMIIGASYIVSIPIGISTTLAVLLHEVPHEMSTFGILIYGGFKAKQALLINFLSALTAIFGALIALLIGAHSQDFVYALLPITAGGFIYIAGSDLIPELHHETKLSTVLPQLFFILLGIGLMSLLALKS